MKFNRFGQAHVLSKYEEGKIRSALPYPIRTIFDIGVFTGERWGAILQLQVRDVFHSDGTVREQITFRGVTRKGSQRRLADSRQVFVHPELRLALQKLSIPDSRWLFPSPVNNLNSISFQSVSQGLNRALSKIGLKHLGISTHSTRRTFITRLANAGVNLHDLKALTGHKNMDSLMRYIDNNPETQKAAILSL